MNYEMICTWVQTETLVCETKIALDNWAKVCNWVKNMTQNEIQAIRKGCSSPFRVVLKTSDNYSVIRYNNGGDKSVFVILKKDVAIRRI